jgi:orotidine-5'-phosphate decarboxylase
MSFYKKLESAAQKNNSLLCVGLDPDFAKLPESVKTKDNPQFEFNKAIIDATHDLVCVFKPNPAFYESRGDRGVRELKMTCDYIHDTYPEIPVLVDAKRGDIGNTNNGYAEYVFDYLKADAITVMPYLGIESLAPYFAYTDKGIIVGCHSSNPGSKEFQELLIDGRPLYEIVAENLVKQYGENPNTMMFMGATYPEQLTDIRKIVHDMTLLVPGVGAQGGSVENFVKMGENSKNAGLMINASRSIIFASGNDDFAEIARGEAEKLRNEINLYRI